MRNLRIIHELKDFQKGVKNSDFCLLEPSCYKKRQNNSQPRNWQRRTNVVSRAVFSFALNFHRDGHQIIASDSTIKTLAKLGEVIILASRVPPAGHSLLPRAHCDKF